MFLKGWNYLRGYLEIEVRGFSVERFVNLAVHRGIYLWDIHYTTGGVTMKVSIQGFKLLKPCAAKTKCHIKIINKNGYPFLAHRYRRRKFLAGGFLFFIASLYLLSSFLWLVETEGNERVTTEAILSFCSENGLKNGTLKLGYRKSQLEKDLLLKFPDLNWANIHIQGTRAVVQVTEIIPKQELIDRTTPCDIVASKDGLIVSIAVSGGTPQKKTQDVVQKGDLLVSSEIIVKEDETGIMKEYVHASAEVWARMYDEIFVEVPYTYMEKEYTENTKNYRTLQVFGYNLNLNPLKSGIPFQNYDKITSRSQLKLGDNYPLPFLLITEQAREFQPVEKQRTVEQAEDLADSMITGRIIREFDFEADIIDKALEVQEGPDGLTVRALITTLQRIDEERPFTLPEENMDTEIPPETLEDLDS